MITWEDYRNGNYDIYAQRYNSSGNPLGSNFKVNDDIGTTYQAQPAIAMDGSGNFVITWSDWRNYDNSHIYAQRYNSSGIPLGTNFKVNDDVGTAGQGDPTIAMNGSGNFVITWEDYRTYGGDIYAQRFNSAGTALGANFKVNDDVGTIDQYCPNIAVDVSGNFVITWVDRRNGTFNDDIYAQRYNSSGTPLGTNFEVNDDFGTADQHFPAIAMNGSGNFVITWKDNRILGGYRFDIYAQRYNSSGTPLGTNFKVLGDFETANQYSPAMAVDGSGNSVITWMDQRNGNNDIYAQRCSYSGSRLGANFKVNTDVGTAYQGYPTIAMNSSGNFVITWEDNRNGNYDIYAQRYNSSGNPLGSNFKVNDDVGTAGQYAPAIAMDGSGNFVITWYDYRNGNYDIYAQRYNSSGTPLGTNFEVNDDFGTADQHFPAIAMNGSGNFVITWKDNRNGNYDVYYQRYNSSGTPLGTNFKVNDDAGTAGQYDPAISLGGSGNFVITWYDNRNGNYDIYFQRYNSSGTPLGTNFKVNDDAGTAQQIEPAVAIDGSGNFVITWRDHRNGGQFTYDVYAQKYNSSGAPMQTNYLVPNPLYSSYDQESPAVAATNANIYFAWEDYRRGNPDIYAKIADWNWSGCLCGDANDDKVVDIGDIVLLINYVFYSGAEPICDSDVNNDGVVDIGDIVYLINYVFYGGTEPNCG